jgi:serine protease AprX
MVMNKFLKKVCVIVFCFSASINLNSQTKYWVKFKDKNGTPFNTANPSAYLTAKSILRRTTYNIPVHFTDLPCTPSYITQVKNVSGVTLLYVSKWLNGAVISTSSPAALTTLNSFSFVQSSNAVNRYKLNVPLLEDPAINNANKTAQTTAVNIAGGSYWQNKQLNVDCIHSQGYRGQNMTIGVFDSGFLNVNNNPVFDSLRNRGGILGTRDFVTGGTSVYEDDSHGAMVLSCMAAIKPNVILGTAPMANYWLFRTEDVATETISEEYNWIRAAEFADSVGVDVLTTSLGYTTFDNPSQNHSMGDLNGKIAPMSIASNLAARKGMLVLNSAGNGNGSGSLWPKIGIPADADSIATVGAIDSLSNVTSFSSIGPTADGRIKPDLVARGGNSWVSFPSGNVGQVNGTSFSCPILAGAMACFWQAHKTWSSNTILDTLRKTASNASNPDNSRGWGTPNMCSLPVGISENSFQDLKLKVMPNPFSNQFTIEVLENTNEINIEFYNIVGERISLRTINNLSGKYTCNFNEIASGIYFVKVISPKGSAIKKVVKE